MSYTKYIGVNDHTTDLFEGQYRVPNGMSYNSYVIVDKQIAVMDTVDGGFVDEWLANLEVALDGRTPDYLVVQHMEPDHSGGVEAFVRKYPTVKVVGNEKTFKMIECYFCRYDMTVNKVVVKDGDVLSLGEHTLTFVFAPMVHWPEVFVTYDSFDKTLYSADAFGKFGALDVDEPWTDEARRYYIGIVGKYGSPVQTLLKKAASLDIARICPLHGPVLTDNLGYYIGLYDTWSRYKAEEKGVCVAYTSVYGHTKEAAELMAHELQRNGATVVVYDLARCDMSQAVADAFRFSNLVIATTTYCNDVFPPMRAFAEALVERSYKNRDVYVIENGSWAPNAAKVLTDMFAKCVGANVRDHMTIWGAMDAQQTNDIAAVAADMAKNLVD